MALSRDLHSNPTKALQPRLLAMMWILGVVFLLLLSRIYTLQILRGDELTQKGQQNMVQRVRVSHDRGIVFDRHGEILADNRPSLDLQVTPAFLGKRPEAEATLRQVALLLDMSTDELAYAQEQVFGKAGLDLFQPIVINRDLTPEEVESIEAQRSVFRLDGVEIVEGRRRAYPNGALAAHLLGYVKEIDAGQLDAERARGNPRHYVLGDFIGRDGIERFHEEDLRGADGFDFVLVDAKGRRQMAAYLSNLMPGEQRVDPTPGQNVFLTIDAELQRRAEAAFDGRAGSIVALDPSSGDVLALVSVPTFNPSLVSGLLGRDEKARLDTDPLKPWVNRAIQGQYAPGSTFKAITALAALSEHATSPREKIHCPGFYRMGRQRWRCHKDSGHGRVDLHDAIKVSCDTYFYTMAGRIGIDPIAEMSRLFGLGRRTGIPLRNEQPGLVPDEAFHDRVDAKTGGYQRGMSVNTSIGQGSLLMTPLQLALAYMAIANRGKLWVPQVVDRIETADFRVVRRFLPQAQDGGEIIEEVLGDAPSLVEAFDPKMQRSIAVDPENLAAVQDGLIAVAAERGGTAFWRKSKKVSMAGKTGTAQVVRLGRDRLKPDEIPYEERDHAWFVAYAPAVEPELVVAVLNEHSGHGSSKAAPIAVKVIDAFFDLRQERAARATAEQGAGP